MYETEIGKEAVERYRDVELVLEGEVVVLDDNADKNMLDVGDNDGGMETDKTELAMIVLLDSEDEGPPGLGDTILMLVIVVLCVSRLVPPKLLS